MDYELFYSELQTKEKGLGDTIAKQQKTFKSISKNAASGDLKSLSKDIAAMEALIADHTNYLHEIKELTESFNAQEYMEHGDFAKQMLSYCESMGVDVKGEFPVYDVFPYKVKVDYENQDIFIDKKKLPCARPQYLVSHIKQNRERLMKASFNANTFLNEIATAYDNLSTIKRKDNNKKRELELSLRDLHRFLAPMSRFRKDYDMQSFAFDLARLYASDFEMAADGRQFIMGPGRNQPQNIRILDKNGNESWVGTIKFFSNETNDDGNQ
jgi:hypothetical protein